MKVVIITGMSGAGRSRAADWFEDQGYYCVDNMPPALIGSFLEMASADTNRIEKVCFVTDRRSGRFFDELSRTIDELRAREEIQRSQQEPSSHGRRGELRCHRKGGP